jgi:hypothetical protein
MSLLAVIWGCTCWSVCCEGVSVVPSPAAEEFLRPKAPPNASARIAAPCVLALNAAILACNKEIN